MDRKTASMIDNYHSDALKSFRSYKKLAERAIEQVSDDESRSPRQPICGCICGEDASMLFHLRIYANSQLTCSAVFFCESCITIG